MTVQVISSVSVDKNLVVCVRVLSVDGDDNDYKENDGDDGDDDLVVGVLV